jgi:hypothetical protein
MSENESGFYKLKDDVQQAFLFRDQVMAALGNPDDAIAKIKELAEVRNLMANAYNPLKAEPIEDGAYFKIGNHHYTELVCFAARARSALGFFLGESMSDNNVVENIEKLRLFQIRVKEALYYSVIPSEVTDGDAIVKIEQLKCLGQQDLGMFWRKIQVLLGDTEIDFESAYNRIVDLLHNPEQFTGDKDREIERLTRCISGIASFLDLPSDAKQPDICFAIMELKKEYKKLNREPLSNEQIVIADLRHDLIVAQKIIARLVGE